MGDQHIFITKYDATRLRALIESSGEGRHKAYLEKLGKELDRAKIVSAKKIPHDVITMNSKVRLKDLDTHEEMTYSLVFPDKANIAENAISILAPVGTAMIGYRVGDVIEWEVPSGLRRLKVEEIIYQPEASGDYHL
jgi:regulator of nucleoside diphosphate kinase